MTLVFASNNQNKIAEIQSMLPANITILSLADIGCNVNIPETAATIEGNAILKANYITENFGYDCFADDSGLEVAALNGAPGVHSARYAGLQRDDADNIRKLLAELEGKPDRSARFKTVIALNANNAQHLFAGTIDGVITSEPKGNQGFGYDPVFRANEHSSTFAELSMHEKAVISHRGKAVAQLIAFLKN
ncbi:MAG TPA: non-canonical purine NTP diphosphatase [Flavobacterium sp.]|jgi:XTP/dITP diphosphohydrolase